MKSFIKIILYLIAFTLANFLVIWFGKEGLLLSSLFLIPFDFVMRCIFHETLKGFELIWKMTALVVLASLITFFINRESANIALASSGGFLVAQIASGIFYQAFIKAKYFIKVNGSDLVGILVDSIIFQLIAFSSININITLSQFFLKVIGGLMWYYILFVKFKLHKKW